MLRVLTAAPDATGTGVDIDAEALARGREAATARGLADRVRFVEGSATETPTTPPTSSCAWARARPSATGSPKP